MKLARPLLTLSFFALLALALPASAQYMWLDSSGDGINDSKDHLNAVGIPTTVDIYLATDRNADGSTAVCDMADGDLWIWRYNFCLTLTNGTAAFSGFQNFLASATLDEGGDSTSTEYAHGFGSPYMDPPGTYHLARFTVTLLTETGTGAALNVVGSNGLSASPTSFGTQCTGLDFDNAYKLGPNACCSTDWTDTAGLKSEGATSAVPVEAASRKGILIQAVPNPLNPSTEVRFAIHKAGRVSVRIFDPSGRLVKVLSDGNLPAGDHALRWDGSDGNGMRVASGVYYLRLSAPEGDAGRTVAVLK